MSAGSTTRALRTGRWTVAPSTARLRFTVRKLGLIRVSGTFPLAPGAAVDVVDGAPARVSAAALSAGIDTGNARRDRDVQGARFLDAAAHERFAFTADDVRPGADGGHQVRGELVVRGRTAPLVLDVRVESVEADGTVRVRGEGMLDRAPLGIGAPRWLVGRHLAVTVEASLLPPAP